ncbi:TetR/AcrR family transcriptional regulator [Actinocorallia libanotica]|uniref:TetR/AcrR family transcriptional regulator n=2 Tax=Actinocorallia libanotica TaxID=46162 RepID=A0ABN1Q1F9_9ACTN
MIPEMSTRAYRGRSPQERVAERRERLLAAALDLWSELGWSGVSVRGVCARAGLTDRYFYESFTDRDALLLAVFDRVRDELTGGLPAAPFTGEPRAVMRTLFLALFTALAEDPRYARVAFTDPAGSPALETRRHDALLAVADAVAAGVSSVAPGDFRGPALFCVGGVGGLISAWLAGRYPAAPEELADRCTELCARVFGV